MKFQPKDISGGSLGEHDGEPGGMSVTEQDRSAAHVQKKTNCVAGVMT